MINLFFPFVFLSITSLLFSKTFNINLNKSFLISILFIPLFIFFIGNFVSLYWSIYMLILINFFLILYNQNFKKILTIETLQDLFLYFVIYFLIILYSSNFFLHKYDEFSEYAIISKLIFAEGELANNIHNIFAKGSPHKINILAYLNYFFLKTSLIEFKEQTLYIAQNTFNVIIILNLINFISKNSNKIFFFIILFFLSFILSTGFDKVYLDTTLGLLISLIITIQFQDPNKSKYLIIFLAMIFLFSLKTSASIIFMGISFIFIFYYFLEKNYKIIVFYSFIILSSIGVEKFYLNNFYFNFASDKDKDKEIDNLISDKVYLKNQSYSLNYEKKLTKINELKNSNFNYLILNKNLKDLFEKGIYHSSTFLIFNKIFEKLNINFKLIEIPLTLFFWLILISLLVKVINIEDKIKLTLFTTSYILFIFLYWLIILYWSWSNQLINEDFSIIASWQRHLGSVILGILLYLILIFLQKNKLTTIQIFLILIFIVIISKPNSIKNFFPKSFVMKDIFWSKKFKQRQNISKLSDFINNYSENYSTIFYFSKFEDPYFLPILNYELIDKNLVAINFDLFEKYYNSYLIKYPSLIKNTQFYLLGNKIKIENLTKLINSKKIKIIYKTDFDDTYSIYKIKIL